MANLPTVDFLMLQLRLKRLWQRHSLGQNFLSDPAILERIAEAAGADHQAVALEVGAGPGTLTSQLAARAGAVEAIELDSRLEAVHRDAFEGCSEVTFHYGDALRLDLATIAREAMGRRGLTQAVLTGNLPFQITSPLLFAQCGPGMLWSRMVVMIQREVADRIVAAEGCKAYGILTVKLGLWWRVIDRFDVTADKFFPRPKVDASVLVFDPLPAEQMPPAELWPGLSALIDAAFGQRRKTLVNALAGCWKAWPGKERALAAMAQAGIAPMARAENLTLAQFVTLYQLLSA